ncbi:MAG TPA: threonine/serine dehydratase [Solirubrobacteraceae bacterium]|nr:threonine/serine dehydratase [Solirubrobacteraceae bacterium]
MPRQIDPVAPRARRPALQDIRAAAARIAGHVTCTPVLASPLLDARVRARVHAKAEPLQRSGSFKARGAFNRLLTLDGSARRRGVVAYSSGNHGAAVALAAHELGVPAAVVVPADTPALKLATIRFYGAELHRYDPGQEDRLELAAALARERGMTLVPPFDDPTVIAGQGTIGLELEQQAPGLDTVVVPVGGGGLIAGVGSALKALRPSIRIVGVEPAAGDDTARSIAAGRRLALPLAPATIADGLRTLTPGELTFPINVGLIDAMVTVEDSDIAEAMRLCFELLKLVVEPSGAVALAALTSGRLDVRGQAVGVVLSGGNVDAIRFSELAALTADAASANHTPARSTNNAPAGGPTLEEGLICSED